MIFYPLTFTAVVYFAVRLYRSDSWFFASMTVRTSALRAYGHGCIIETRGLLCTGTELRYLVIFPRRW